MRLAADSHRERALASLTRAYVSGRIDVEELAARSERAVRARTTDDLRAVLRGLPPRFDELIDRGWRTARFVGLLAALAAVWTAASVFLLVVLIVLAASGVGGLELLAVPSAWVVMSALLAASALRAARRR